MVKQAQEGTTIPSNSFSNFFICGNPNGELTRYSGYLPSPPGSISIARLASIHETYQQQWRINLTILENTICQGFFHNHQGFVEGCGIVKARGQIDLLAFP